MARLAVLCGVVVLSVSSPPLNASAPSSDEPASQAVPWTPQPGARRELSKAGPKDPYHNLFGVPDRPTLRWPNADPAPNDRSNPSPASGQPRVVCGMTIVPVNPAIDAEIHLKRPDAGTEYTMRTLKPPMCWPE